MRILILLFLSVNLFGQYNAGTNRKAKDYSAYIMQRLQQSDPNTQGYVFTNTITTGTSVGETCSLTARNTLIANDYSADFEALPTVWSFTKSASNPLIAISNGAGGLEFYPPIVKRWAVNEWFVMAKANIEGWASTSTDGVTWTAPTKLISKGTGTQWDLDLVAPSFIALEGSTYKCLYSGYNVTNPSNPGIYNYKIGMATTSTYTTGWTKEASYIYDVSEYNTVNGTSWNSIQLGDAVKIGNKWWYFGSAYNNTFTDGDIIYGVGDENGALEDIRMDTKIASFKQINSYWEWFQRPNVFQSGGYWYMTMSMGNIIYTTSKSNITFYSFKTSNSEPRFSRADFIYSPIIMPNESAVYEDNFNYNGTWVKNDDGTLISPSEFSGNKCFFYSGHTNGAVSPIPYTGAMCLALINSIP